MYQLTKIQDALAHLVGFEQDMNPAKYIDTELTETESGLYFQAAHPMVTLNVIRQNMPLDWLMQYPNWDNSAIYAKGTVVQYNSETWESTIDNNTGNEPGTGTQWTAYDYFSAYLQRQVRDGIGTMVQRFMREKGTAKLAPDIINRKTFFDGEGYMYDTIPTGKNLVGFEIIPRRAMGVSTRIERIGLQFRGGTANITLYLFHSSLTAPVKSIQVKVKGEGGFQWFPVNEWYMPYIGDNNAGGSWYIVYDQNELPAGVQAINVGKDFSRKPTGGCCGSLGNYQLQKQFTENLEFYPFSNDAGLVEPVMWDISRNIYPGCVNYGMNVEVTIGCDLTDFIITQRQSFASCLQKQVAANLMRRFAFNPDDRTNLSQLKISSERIAYEVDGEPGKQSAFAKELSEEYKSLDVNTRGIDKVCLPCGNRGIKYTNA